MSKNMDILNIAVGLYALLVCIIKLIGDARINTIRKGNRRFFYELLLYEGIMISSIILAHGFHFYIQDRKLMIILCDISYAVYYFAYYVFLCTFVYYSADYISGFCGEKVKTAFYTVPVTVIYAFAWLISAFNGMILYFDGDDFIPGPLYTLGQVGGYLLIIEPFYFAVKYRKSVDKKNGIILGSFMILPLLGVILREIYPGPEYMPFMILLSLILMNNTIQYEQETRILKQQDKIERDRIKILLSQIKPHFLYNVLNSIYVLCDKDAEQAQEAIGNFAEYLRSNLNSLEQEENIPFSKELSHVENYVSLEKMRFRDKLEVEYCIQEDNFRVPPLTIQILVENAVKHGIQNRKEGGKIIITTYSEENNYVIEVRDDGVGFDMEKLKNDESLHVGLKNLRERLAMMAGGNLQIESKDNEGTKAVVRIPKNVRVVSNQL